MRSMFRSLGFRRIPSRPVLLAPIAWMPAALSWAQGAAPGSPPAKFAGTYRIASWEKLERRGLYHFFYLHSSGHFLLGGEWPGNETSRFVGTWSVTGNRLTLTGRGAVETNQGAWEVPFHRTYLISVEGNGFRLAPLPEKNRYGLMGWPDSFGFYRRAPLPNLPSGGIPSDDAGLPARIQALLSKPDAG